MAIAPAFSFCPVCGGSLQTRLVVEEERERLVCDECGHIHYVNPKIVAGTIPMADGKIWLLRRAIEPRLGYWTFPAGFMELGERVEDAAMRETYEELGMRVELGSLIGVYSRPELSTVHIIYHARPLTAPVGGKETLEFALFDRAIIPWEDLAFWSTHQALRDWAVQTSGT